MHYIFVLIIGLSIQSCKSNKSKIVDANQTTIEQQKAKETANLVVSFYSKGSGIDYELANQFDDMLNKKMNQDQLVFSKKGWGREGETDFCINVNSSFSKKEKAELITEIKLYVSKSTLVHLKEDAECRP